jgi:hypothetical protein
MREMRLSDADLSSLAWHGLKCSKFLLVLLVVHLAHVVHVTIADLILPTVVPSSDNFILVKALDNDGAIGLRLVIKGQATLYLVFPTLL